MRFAELRPEIVAAGKRRIDPWRGTRGGTGAIAEFMSPLMGVSDSDFDPFHHGFTGAEQDRQDSQQEIKRNKLPWNAAPGFLAGSEDQLIFQLGGKPKY
jgi:hypothetical protein